jgi:hypothetical protein
MGELDFSGVHLHLFDHIWRIRKPVKLEKLENEAECEILLFL